MKRRQYLSAAAAAIGGTLAGCIDGSDTPTDTTRPVDGNGDGPQTGVLSTAVSDQPNAIDDFEQLVVTIEEIWVYPKQDGGDGEDGTEENTDGSSDDGRANRTDDGGDSDETREEARTNDDGDDTEDGESPDAGEGDGDGDGERIVIDADGAEADLVKLQGDAQAVINDAELPVGEYSQIKLRVGDEVDGVLTDGSEAEVVTPGNAPLQFKEDFEVREGTRTTFVADFAPHRRGNNGYIIRPVASEVKVSYEEIEEDSATETDAETDTRSETDSGANETESETTESPEGDS